MGVTQQSTGSPRRSQSAVLTSSATLPPIPEDGQFDPATVVVPATQQQSRPMTSPTIGHVSPLQNLIIDLTKYTDPNLTESETYKTVKRNSRELGLNAPSRAEVARYETKPLPLIPSPTLSITEMEDSEWQPGQPASEQAETSVSDKRKSQISHLHIDGEVRVAGEVRTGTDPSENQSAAEDQPPIAWLNRIQRRAQGNRKMLEHYCEKASGRD